MVLQADLAAKASSLAQLEAVQAELEQQWAAFAKGKFEQARARAEQAVKLAR